MKRLLALLALPLAACATPGDYAYAPPAPAAPLAWPSEQFVVTAPGPSGAMTPYHVVPTPSGAIVQPGVLQPLRSYRPVTP